ncbi:hypothetical protein O1611_g2003 [Lasiodiplodia mahajangana]|uniref:Uncharacterized protein n=1 Tax=Lasiodiplodia mahajangana TaxID=1108764 RepID=A0ACC2JVY7_9PEZI|nr:hypothetical protein O1611_g2003 [Lasiodiplodia mahajangana]
MSNLGPLPTDFLTSSGCESALQSIYYVDNNYLVQGNIDQLTCYPNGYVGNTQQYYSPARCPSGFTQACSGINRINTLEETINICCPTQRPFVCQSTSSLDWESTLGCVSQNTRVQTLDVVVASDGSTTPYTVRVGAIGAYSIQVRYQSTDFISSTSSTIPIAPTPITTSSTNTSTDGSRGLTVGNNNNGGISTGAAVGITIGAIAGFLTVTAIIWYLVKQKLRRRRPSQTIIQQQQYSAKTSALNYPQELQGENPIHELPTPGLPPSTGSRQLELPFSTQHER